MANKVYDGNATPRVRWHPDQPGGRETLGLTVLDALFDTANVGTAKPVTGTVALINGTGLASNYQLSDAAFNSTADITPPP